MKSKISVFFIIVFFAFSITLGASPQSEQPQTSPKTSFVFDSDFQAELIPLNFTCQGSKLNGVFAKASGDGQHPTAILLKGFPGGERGQFGLARLIPQSGWNAFVFSYRGSWGSEGEFSPLNSLEDVAEAIKFLRKDEISSKYNIDPENIALLGSSYGACMAVTAAASDSSIKHVMFAIGENLAKMFSEIEKKTVLGEMLRKTFQWQYEERLKGKHFDEVIEESIANKSIFDIDKYASVLSKRNLLVIGAWQDDLATIEQHMLPFVRALQRSKAENLTPILINDTHRLPNNRMEFFQIITTWLYENRQK